MTDRSASPLPEHTAGAARRLIRVLIVDDEDERLVLGGSGKFRAEVLPEDSSGEWRELAGGDELVEFYDPTDVFGDPAERAQAIEATTRGAQVRLVAATPIPIPTRIPIPSMKRSVGQGMSCPLRRKHVVRNHRRVLERVRAASIEYSRS